MIQNNYINSTITRLVIVADFVLMNAILIVLYKFMPEQLPNYFKTDNLLFILFTNISMMVSQYCFTNIVHRRLVSFGAFASRVFRLVLAHLIVLALIMACFGDDARGGMVHFLVFYGCILFLVLLFSRWLERLLLNRLRKSGFNQREVVFIGNDPSLNLILNIMLEDMSTGYHVKGYFSNEEMVECPKELKYLGTLDDLMTVINNGLEKRQTEDDNPLKEVIDSCQEVYCSLSHSQNKTIEQIMRYCDSQMLHFMYVPRTLGNMQLKLKMTNFGNYVVFTNLPEPLLLMSNRIVKRIFDIMFSSVVCLCLLPFIPIITLIIKSQSRGPIFFGQDRTGYNGQTFKCWKFRSMHVNVNADKVQATKDDPRKFPFGNFMRSTSIDELPQFFNVLKGDMSIVGPRPHMLYHTDTYSQLINKYMVRHMAKPGITGWAQVTGCRGETKELWQMEQRVQRDIWYIENWSFWLDLKIVFMTAFSMFFKNKNAY